MSACGSLRQRQMVAWGCVLVWAICHLKLRVVSDRKEEYSSAYQPDWDRHSFGGGLEPHASKVHGTLVLPINKKDRD